MASTKYNKLVRDRIPEIMRENGARAVIHIANKKEYQRKLYDKLQEEIAEFQGNPSEEEFADVMEVLDAMAQFHQLNASRVKVIQKTKAKQRGRFKKRIILDESLSQN